MQTLTTHRKETKHRGLLLGVLVFACVIALFIGSLGQINQRMESQQQLLLKQTIEKAALTCYAIEGFYPPTLDYIRDHYAVFIDEDRYMVVYDIFASNIRPEVTVVQRGAQE